MTYPWMLRSQDQPWGDYGDLLAYGMTAHLSRNERGELRHERCGPFIPSMYESGIADLLATQTGRDDLDSSGLRGFEFRLVELALVTRVDWQDWDLSAPDPLWYPESGEPEDYVLAQPHDPGLATEVGPVWEVVLRTWRDSPSADLVSAMPDRRSTLASDAAAEWITDRYADWLRVVPNPLTET